MALNFLKGCMHKSWHHVIDSSSTLAECLRKFGTYASNKELFLRKTMENLKAYPKSWSYIQDKKMLNKFDTGINQITELNSAFMLDFTMVQ